jgi:phosphopentomutase
LKKEICAQIPKISLGHTVAAEKPQLPELQKLGLGNIHTMANLPPAIRPEGAFGKAAIFSNGKDTTVGHWEIADSQNFLSPFHNPL